MYCSCGLGDKGRTDHCRTYTIALPSTAMLSKDPFRRMLGILGRCWATRARQKPCLTTISPQTKVCDWLTQCNAADVLLQTRQRESHQQEALWSLEESTVGSPPIRSIFLTIIAGNLALSRAIGDFEFKQNYSLDPEHQIVTADPEIITHSIDGEEEFLVLACDGTYWSSHTTFSDNHTGIWDCLSSQQVIDFTRRAIANGDGLGKICENMMVKCLATDSETGGIGCDNMTVIIVALLGGRTPEEWQKWVKQRVENKGECRRIFVQDHAHTLRFQLAMTLPPPFPTSSVPRNPPISGA